MGISGLRAQSQLLRDLARAPPATDQLENLELPISQLAGRRIGLPRHLAGELRLASDILLHPGAKDFNRRELLPESVVQIRADAPPFLSDDLQHYPLQAPPLDAFGGQRPSDHRAFFQIIERAMLHDFLRNLLVALTGDEMKGMLKHASSSCRRILSSPPTSCLGMTTRACSSCSISS